MARHRSLLGLLLLVYSGVLGCDQKAETPTAKPVEKKVAAKPNLTPRKYEPAAEYTLLMDPVDLRRNLDDPNLVIVDSRPEVPYLKGRIPNAVRVDADAWREKGLSPEGLKDEAFWSETVGNLGIGPDTQVVVYGASLADAARIWWMLSYLGHQKVALLDGGWETWRREGCPINSVETKVKPTKFTVKLQPDRLIEIEQLKQNVAEWPEGQVILDARSPAEFDGSDAYEERVGHIPGAVNFDWQELVSENGRFKSKEELVKLFKEREISPENVVITHCQSGGRSAIQAFVLELLGYPQVKNYFCSWQEWAADQDAPVTQEVEEEEVVEEEPAGEEEAVEAEESDMEAGPSLEQPSAKQ